jgi:hypothetical protein
MASKMAKTQAICKFTIVNDDIEQKTDVVKTTQQIVSIATYKFDVINNDPIKIVETPEVVKPKVVTPVIEGYSGTSFGYSGTTFRNNNLGGISGISGVQLTGHSGVSYSGYSGYSGVGYSGTMGYSGFSGVIGYSGQSGDSGRVFTLAQQRRQNSLRRLINTDKLIITKQNVTGARACQKF